jgi:hypothetical protein
MVDVKTGAIGCCLIAAAWQDYYEHKIFDGYALAIGVIGLLYGQPKSSQLLLGLILVIAGVIPAKRPVWGMGDALLLLSLSLCYRVEQITDMFIGATAVLILWHCYNNKGAQAATPLAPAVFLSWLCQLFFVSVDLTAVLA